MDTKNKFNQALVLIEKLEAKYGSMKNVPDDDPVLAEIREIYPVANINEDTENRMKRLAIEGYPISYISCQCRLNYKAVYYFLEKNNIPIKSTFKYKVISNNGSSCYVTSLIKFTKYVYSRKFRYMEDAAKYLESVGCTLKKSTYVWKQIPDGDYYFLNYVKRSVMKNGNDSYIFPSAITKS